MYLHFLVSLSRRVAIFPVNKIHVIIWFPLKRFSQNDFYYQMVFLFLYTVNLACVLGSSEGCYLYTAKSLLLTTALLFVPLGDQ